MRKMPLLLAVLLTFALLPSLVGTAAPGPGDPIYGSGTVHGGLYPYNFWFSTDYDDIAAAAGRKVTFAGLFHNVAEPNGPGWYGTEIKLDEAWAAEATPFSNLEFAEEKDEFGEPIPGTASAAYIAGGGRDADLVVWASTVDQWLAKGGDRSLIIAPMQEMNGSWVPYGMDPTNFKLAYLHVRNTVEANVNPLYHDSIRWAFAPNGWSEPPYSLADYYPGDDVVDVIGISAYNFGTTTENGWETPAQAIDPWVNELRAMTAGSADKPYLLAQTGSVTSGGSKNQWIRDVYAHVEQDPNLVGLIYFNITNAWRPEWDWRFWPTGTNYGFAGWRDGISRPSTSYQWPLTNWFQPGPLPFEQYAPACPVGNTCDEIALVKPSSRVDLYDEIVPGSGINQYWFGDPGDIPLMGDWDGDGEDTPGMYRPSSGYVYVRNSNTTGPGDIDFYYGIPGDIPIVGDWDGDGFDTVSIYRNGRVFISNTLGGVAEFDFLFGNPGDRPFAGDFDGDGDDTVGLYRETSGRVYFRNTLDFGVADFDYFFGIAEDKVMAGDWNGDGTDTVAVYRPSAGMVYFKFDHLTGVADYELDVGNGFIAANRAGD